MSAKFVLSKYAPSICNLSFIPVMPEIIVDILSPYKIHPLYSFPIYSTANSHILLQISLLCAVCAVIKIPVPSFPKQIRLTTVFFLKQSLKPHNCRGKDETLRKCTEKVQSLKSHDPTQWGRVMSKSKNASVSCLISPGH